jgi:hypothetical protein
MASNFLEDLEPVESSQGGGQPTPDDTTPGDDATVQQGGNGSDSPPEGEAGEQSQGTTSTDVVARQPAAVDGDLVKAREEAAYWRGVAEAAARNGQSATPKTPDLTEEQLKELEDRFLVDPRGETQKIIGEVLGAELKRFTQQQSVSRMMTEVDDYDTVHQKVNERYNRDPAFRAHIDSQVLNHPDPARVLYQIGKHMDSFTANPVDKDAERKAMEEKIRAEVEAELKKKFALQEAGNTPPTPATAKGSGGTSPANPSGNDPDPLANNPFD